jgi:hypothetical protein
MNIFKYFYILDMSILSDEQKLNKKFLTLKTAINDIDSYITTKNNQTIFKLKKYSTFKDFSIEDMKNYYISNIINPIQIKIKNLYTQYKTYPDNIIYNNLEINILLCNLLYRYCLFIYENKTYIFNIIEFKQVISAEVKNDKELDKDFDNFLLEKIKTINPSPIIIKYNNSLYYKYLLYLFNSNILNEIYDYENTYIIDYINIEKSKLHNRYTIDDTLFENITIETFNDSTIVDYIKFIILIIKDLYKTPKQHYITLPQYQGICWFISMITSISYSDGSKNLLIEKKFQATDDFSNYIYYIIDNITRQHKIYNKDNYLTDCELFKKLKTEPILLLKKIILILFKSISPEIILKYLSKIVMQYCDKTITNILDSIKTNIDSGMISSNINHGLDSVIYTVVVDILSNSEEIEMLNFRLSSIDTSKRQKISQISRNITSKDNYNDICLLLIEYIYNSKLIPILNSNNEDNIFMRTNLNIIGLASTNNNIISYFYELLGVSNKFFHKYENDDEETVIIDKNSETIIEDPEIIIIYKDNKDNKVDNDDKEYINLFGTDFDETIDDDLNNIKYKEKDYKLDYIIHASNNKFTCINCAHCICGIHYENEEYYYDSSYDINKLTCQGETVYLPCPLLKSTWSDKINQDYCYKLEQCAHIEWKEKNFNPIEKNSSTNNICYSKSTNIMLVYIKVKEISGGKQEKILLIHNNIKYNKTIYLKENKKYILFKNKYLLLSKLKYNNKLNLYYI